MSFFDYYRARREQARSAPLRLRLEPSAWSTNVEGGERLAGHGYALKDESDRPLTWDDRRLRVNGFDVLKVAGASYRLDELQDDAFAPGSPLLLRPEPDNPHDVHAVGVWDAAGRLQAGYVPAERAPEVGRRLESGPLDVFSLWEWRDSDGRRCGLRLLVCAPGALAERPRPLRRR